MNKSSSNHYTFPFLWLLLFSFITSSFAFANINDPIINFSNLDFKNKLLTTQSGDGSYQQVHFASTETPIYDEINDKWKVTQYHKIDSNGDNEIQLSEALAIKYLSIGSFSSSSNNFTGLEAFLNLLHFESGILDLSTFNFSNLLNLKSLSLGYVQFNATSIIGLSNLIYLNSSYNNLVTNLNLSSLTNLKVLKMANYNNLVSLNVSGLINLEKIIIYNTNFSGVSSAPKLTTINFSGLSSLKEIICTNNYINTLTLTGLINLKNLDCSTNKLTTLNLQGLSNLKDLKCNNNLLTALNFTSLINLETLIFSGNQITTETLLNLQELTNLKELKCGNNQLEGLNISMLTNLISVSCSYNLLSSLDVTNLKKLETLECRNNQLVNLFIKNGRNESNLNFSQNPNLRYLCADEEQLAAVQTQINSYGYATNCHVNSYCSFVPGGAYYMLQGISTFDNNNNGCEVTDGSFPNQKFNITNGGDSGSLIANASGSYIIPVQAGTQTITPVFENPSYFNASPTSATVTFPETASPFTQNFCITPNGVHHDVEATLIPITPARPGFNTTYKMIYKNKGTQVENGTVIFSMYQPNVVDFVSCSPTFNAQTTNASLETFTWNYSNLQPFETREIEIVLNLNSPMETPPLNAGAYLSYDAQILINNSDENTFDNFYGIRQLVVNSYDPNDKTCIEGATITPEMVGKYVHYVIRFENTGTFPAENIVVKDMIDLAKFDIATLLPINASHNFETRIAGNKVEFIFENINLPFDDANNDGYVAFKIKTNPTLVLGDTFSNLANIYFDYNFPIITNTATTTVAALSSTDFDFGTHFTLYPNPVKDVLRFQSKDNTSIHSIEIYTTLGQVVLAVTDTLSTVDVSSLQAGNYFIKVHTDLGVSNTKFIKE